MSSGICTKSEKVATTSAAGRTSRVFFRFAALWGCARFCGRDPIVARNGITAVCLSGCATNRVWNCARGMSPYIRRTGQYLRHLFAEIQSSLATQGGPVVVVQLENEYANIAKRYKQHGDRYLAWILELGREQGIDVPVVMCEGGANGALEAFNGFSISDDRVSDFRKRRAGQPLMWTELWPGWYDTWSREHHVRDARNVAYHLLRFVAAGGTAWNYYMWHGGTNFGRSSMYLQVNSYDFDAPQDEWGRLTRKGAYFSALHKALAGGKELLLTGKRTESPGEAVWAIPREGLADRVGRERAPGDRVRRGWQSVIRYGSDVEGVGKSAGMSRRGGPRHLQELEVDARTSPFRKARRSFRAFNARRSVALDKRRLGFCGPLTPLRPGTPAPMNSVSHFARTFCASTSTASRRLKPCRL